jgi:exonuclease SbcC
MQLNRLKLVNFRQHADTEIAFGAGITAIIGPNGSGKTTLLEAIAWAFYGNPAARGSRDSIRWNRAAARASVRVEVEFSLGGHEFRVTRTLYNAELFQDRFDQATAIGSKEVSGRVERLLGMTRDEFFSTYFTGQKELAVMSSLGATERARFLSQVLGYEKLRLAQDRLRGARSTLRGELTGLEQGLVDPEELERERIEAEARLTSARSAVDEAKKIGKAAKKALDREGPAWTRMVELRESALALDGELRIAERDVQEARREFERLDRDLAEALAAQTQLGKLADDLARVDPLKHELETLEQEAKSAGRRRSLAGQLSELDEQIERTRKRVESLADAEKVLTKANRALEAARKELSTAEAAEDQARTTWVRDKQDAETKRQNLRDQYLDHQKHRESVVDTGPDGECPVCKRPLGAVYQEALETLGRQLEEIEVKGKYFRTRIDQLNDPPPELQEAEELFRNAQVQVEASVQEVARCEDRVREAKDLAGETARLASRRSELEKEIAGLPDAYDTARHDEVREALRILEPTIQKSTELRVKSARAKDLVAEAEAAERTASETETKVKDLEGAVADLGYHEETYAEARGRYEAAEVAVREAELRLVSAQGDFRAAESSLETARRRSEEREQRAERIEHVRADLKLHDELDRALHDLRLELNATMRPELSERASDFLATLTDGRYHELELDEHYQLLVVEDGQVKPVVSGGEEDVLHLVLRLAISQMVAERAGQPLSLLVLDEIFGSLDEHRRQNVVELLRGLADRFPQVVLITHIDSVRDGVDRVLRVELDQASGAARVSEDHLELGGGNVAA